MMMTETTRKIETDESSFGSVNKKQSKEFDEKREKI